MTTARPRRTRVRRGLLILAAVAATSLGSIALGPLLTAPRMTEPIAAARPSPVVALASPTPEPAPSAHGDVYSGLGPDGGTPAVSSMAIRVPEPSGLTATPAVRRALQARLDQLRARYGVPGISVTILFPDGSSWLGASGVADVATKTPVTPSTSFAIASVSKTFTAALVLGLAQDGAIELDQPARTYLPDLKINLKITVRQLLDHTSGLRDYFFHPAIDRVLLRDPTRRWTTADSLKYVGKSYFKPGEGWHYSNTNYLVLGMLAERVGNAPLGEQIRTRFLDPLGLRHTWYMPTEAPTTEFAHGYRFESTAKSARAIDLSDGTTLMPFTSVVTAAAGAGGLASNTTDLARWARALYAGGVLSTDSIDAILGDISRTQPYKPRVPYGLGVQRLDIDGVPSLGHSGRLLGFRSAIRWLPNEDIAIAVLTNQSRTDPGIFVRALLKIARQGTACVNCTSQR
ncbi:MAG TPA: serine hydrolase domain-containing protein [Methylomirabilota bacterium]|nr:serine hydrolase domain-containing protein [Methylomirabilota bacterium]